MRCVKTSSGERNKKLHLSDNYIYRLVQIENTIIPFLFNADRSSQKIAPENMAFCV